MFVLPECLYTIYYIYHYGMHLTRLDEKIDMRYTYIYMIYMYMANMFHHMSAAYACVHIPLTLDNP